MSGSRPAVRGGEYAARGDYHRTPDPAWDYYPTYVAKLTSVRRWLERLPTGTRVLDAGCGEGILVDEFASNRIDAAAQDWYESQHRMLRATGADPYGPPSLDDWRQHHPGLHSDELILAALREHYDELALERVPYLYRWLEGPASEALEQGLVDAGAFEPIGYLWAGRQRG